MYNKLTNNDTYKPNDPGFLCKGTATKIWRDLVRDGVLLKNKWKNCDIIIDNIDQNILTILGNSLFDILKGPDLTVPALIKEDNNVDFHSVYSQYLYEYLFRMKNIYGGRKPAATFTFLSENELKIRQAFTLCFTSVDQMAEEITAYDESQIFMNLRWYCDPAQQFADNFHDKLSENVETSNRLSNKFNSYYISDSDSST